MEKTRLTLQARLCKIVPNVYFSPPTSLGMTYPCIRYELTNMQVDSADNIKYMTRKRYTLIFITTDPDSVTPDEILSLPYCSLDRTYTSNNLYHFVYTLYW